MATQTKRGVVQIDSTLPFLYQVSDDLAASFLIRSAHTRLWSRSNKLAFRSIQISCLRFEWLESRIALAAGDLRIVNYNIASVQRTAPTSLGTVFEAMEPVSMRVSRPLDVIALQEVTNQSTTTQAVVDQLNAI